MVFNTDLLKGAPSPKSRLSSLVTAVGVDCQSLNLYLITIPIMVSPIIRSALVQGVTAVADIFVKPSPHEKKRGKAIKLRPEGSLLNIRLMWTVRWARLCECPTYGSEP